MKKLIIHKTVHGERYTFSSGHKVIGVHSTNLVQAGKYNSGKITTDIRKTRNSLGMRPKQRYRSIRDAELKLEQSMLTSDDTGMQAIGTGIKGARNGSKVLWDSYRLGRVVAPKTGKALLGTGKRVFTVGNKALTISRGLISGKIILDKSTLSLLKSHTSQKVKEGISKTGKSIKRLPKKGARIVKKGVSSIGKSAIGTGVRQGRDHLSTNDDTGVKHVVASKDFVKYGYSSVKTVRNVITYPVRAAQGRTKVALAYARIAYKIPSSNSIKSLEKVKKLFSKKTSGKAFEKEEDNVEGLLLSMAKRLVFNPITLAILLIIIALLPSSVIGAGVVASVIPGGVIESVTEVADGLKGIYEKVKDTVSGVAEWILGEDPDVDITNLSVEEYLLGANTLYREDVINGIYEIQHNYLASDYHVIKIKNLYGAEASAELSAVDREFIANSVISTEDIVEIIMPLFNSIMLGTYGGRATAGEINSLTEELNNMITDFEVLETSVEECDGHIDTCLNPSKMLYHDSDSGLDCCVSSTGYCPDGSLDSCTNLQKTEVPVYEIVDGELVQTGTVEIEFCGGHQDFYCNGYTQCLSHNVVVFALGNKSIDELMQVYFLDRIDELNNKSNLTEEERSELRTLEQHYQFALGLFEIYKE